MSYAFSFLDPDNLRHKHTCTRLPLPIPPSTPQASSQPLHGGAHVTRCVCGRVGEGRALFFLHSKAAGHVDPHAAAE